MERINDLFSQYAEQSNSTNNLANNEINAKSGCDDCANICDCCANTCLCMSICSDCM